MPFLMGLNSIILLERVINGFYCDNSQKIKIKRGSTMYVLETSELNAIFAEFGISPINENENDVENITFYDDMEGVEKW